METRSSLSGFVCVGELDYVSLKYLYTKFRGRPRRVEIDGRQVAVFYHNNTLYATDANCYHSSGALENHEEDVEDILGQPCIRCPQHKYIISIKTGESFYEAVEFEQDLKGRKKMKYLGWKSKGIMQRVHKVKLNNGKVYVKLSDVKDELESDKYAYNS